MYFIEGPFPGEEDRLGRERMSRRKGICIFDKISESDMPESLMKGVERIWDYEFDEKMEGEAGSSCNVQLRHLEYYLKSSSFVGEYFKLMNDEKVHGGRSELVGNHPERNIFHFDNFAYGLSAFYQGFMAEQRFVEKRAFDARVNPKQLSEIGVAYFFPYMDEREVLRLVEVREFDHRGEKFRQEIVYPFSSAWEVPREVWGRESMTSIVYKHPHSILLPDENLRFRFIG